MNDLTGHLDIKDGPSPLQGNNVVTIRIEGEKVDNLDSGAIQVQNNEKSQGGNNNNCQYNNADRNMDQLLYNTVDDILRLCNAKGEFEVKRGYCKVHGLKAVRHTKSERVWAKIKKNGLFRWRTKKLSVLRCPDSTTNLVGTLDSRDGAGVTRNT